MPTPIAFIEPNRDVLRMLTTVFRAESRFEVVGHYTTFTSALKHLPLLVVPPAIILMEIEFPRDSGIRYLRQLKALWPKALAVVHTTIDQNQKVMGAIRAGADGYLLKRTSPAAILTAVEEALAGGAPMTPTIARKVVRHFNSETR